VGVGPHSPHKLQVVGAIDRAFPSVGSGFQVVPFLATMTAAPYRLQQAETEFVLEASPSVQLCSRRLRVFGPADCTDAEPQAVC